MRECDNSKIHITYGLNGMEKDKVSVPAGV